MEKNKKTKKIKCPIFAAKNEVIEKITNAINEAKDIEGKTMLAQRLLNEVGVLLSCKYFSEEKADCKICHYITELRKQTANLIIKVKQFKGRGNKN